jgi:choline dehydrogenase-like flavoprotein
VFIFYETEEKDIATNSLIYKQDGYQAAIQLWREKKTGFLASSPFGVGAFVPLDNRLKDAPDWVNAPRKPGRDPMGLTAKQPNAEFFTVQCYGGLKSFTHFPEDKQAFGIVAELFSPRSRGNVAIKSPDPMQVPTVDHNYLADPLDVQVLAEACRFANEIMMKGEGTSNIVKGSWPPEAMHHTYTTREAWVDYVRNNATSCISFLSPPTHLA